MSRWLPVGGSAEADRARSGALWSYAAFGVVAVVAALANLSVAALSGERSMGVFAQLYAFFVVGGQLAACGVHDSAQRHVALARERAEDDRPTASAALVAVLLPSMGVALLAAGAAGSLGRLVESEEVGSGLLLLAPGLALLAMNKTLLGVLVGRAELKRVALAQTLRAVALASAIGACIAGELPAHSLGGAFTAAEALVLFPALAWVGVQLPRAASEVRRHLVFGARGGLNAILLETHMRVDVLMLALWLDDAALGIYAFAALVGEGLHQLTGVLRLVVYPDVVGVLARRARGDLVRLVCRTSPRAFLVSLAAGGTAVLIFPWVSTFADPAYAAGLPVVGVLAGSIALYALVAPFDQILLQGGRSGAQSLWMAGAVTLNVVLNALAIPRFGAIGAAFATGLALIVSGAALVLVVPYFLDLGDREGRGS